MRVSLRVLLTMTLLLLTAVPVALFGVWAQKTVLKREFDRVEDSHLLLANTVTLALSRHAVDLRAVFRLLVSLPPVQRSSPEIVTLAKGLNVANFQLLSAKGKLISNVSFDGNLPVTRVVAPESVIRHGGRKASSGNVFFHTVKKDSYGKTRIFLTAGYPDGTLALASISLDYFQKLQSSIRFGESGHSAIVDQAGNVMAHPKQEWVRENKNIAGLKPIQHMLAGKSGVVQFFSPAINEQMITGYAVTPEVNWGVMVPQKVDDLRKVANSVLQQLWSVLVAGLILSGLVAWWLAGWIVKPLKRITDTANRMNAGELNARVLPFVTVPSTEFRVLGEAFDKMAQSLQDNSARLQVKAEAEQLEELGKSEQAGSKGRLLVVDDSPGTALEITGWLSKAGYTTFSALSNEDSLKVATVIRPDIALVSVMSSVEGGFAARRKLINLLAGVEIPVVAIFPDGTSDAEMKDQDINVMAVIKGPLNETRVRNLVDNIRETSDWKILGVKFV